MKLPGVIAILLAGLIPACVFAAPPQREGIDVGKPSAVRKLVPAESFPMPPASIRAPGNGSGR
jgi:hypothetical protein